MSVSLGTKSKTTKKQAYSSETPVLAECRKTCSVKTKLKLLLKMTMLASANWRKTTCSRRNMTSEFPKITNASLSDPNLQCFQCSSDYFYHFHFIYLRINIFDAYTLFARSPAYSKYCHKPANRQVWRYQNR